MSQVGLELVGPCLVLSLALTILFDCILVKGVNNKITTTELLLNDAV